MEQKEIGLTRITIFSFTEANFYHIKPVASWSEAEDLDITPTSVHLYTEDRQISDCHQVP